jgi:hypothetical protein
MRQRNGIDQVPGKHGEYEQEPHVIVLAQKLRGCLGQASLFGTVNQGKFWHDRANNDSNKKHDEPSNRPIVKSILVIPVWRKRHAPVRHRKCHATGQGLQPSPIPRALEQTLGGISRGVASTSSGKWRSLLFTRKAAFEDERWLGT